MLCSKIYIWADFIFYVSSCSIKLQWLDESALYHAGLTMEWLIHGRYRSSSTDTRNKRLYSKSASRIKMDLKMSRMSRSIRWQNSSMTMSRTKPTQPRQRKYWFPQKIAEGALSFKCIMPNLLIEVHFFIYMFLAPVLSHTAKVFRFCYP